MGWFLVAPPLVNEGMPEFKWKYHISENSFGKRSYHSSVKYILVGALGNRTYAVKHYLKTEKR